jgi:hypothetical protein
MDGDGGNSGGVSSSSGSAGPDLLKTLTAEMLPTQRALLRGVLTKNDFEKRLLGEVMPPEEVSGGVSSSSSGESSNSSGGVSGSSASLRDVVTEDVFEKRLRWEVVPPEEVRCFVLRVGRDQWWWC